MKIAIKCVLNNDLFGCIYKIKLIKPVMETALSPKWQNTNKSARLICESDRVWFLHALGSDQIKW